MTKPLKYTTKYIASSVLLLFSLQVSAQKPQDDVSLRESLNQCTKIKSSLERLNCFDQVAGTPALLPKSDALPRKPLSHHSEMMQLVLENEKNRPPEHVGFIISESSEHDGGSKVIITAPALNAPKGKVYLSVSCILNISRLQLVAEESVSRNVIHIRLFIDDRPITNQTPWQVLQTGEVIDAGRGLPGIELIRKLLTHGQRLRIQSDYEPFDGLLFDANALPEFIQAERKACHW